MTPTAERHPWLLEADERVRIGVSVGPRSDWPALRAFVRAAEDLGIDSFWQIDHPLTGHDCWTTLAGLAAVTERIRLGTLVVAAPYRPPALLARMAADVDRMSGGRLILGLGIGDDRDEFDALGVPFAAAVERHALLDRTITAIRAQFTDMAAPPVQRPYVPLLIGGGGDRSLRRAARDGDVSNFGPHPLTGGVDSIGEVARRLAKLDAYCAEFGRPRTAVLRTHTLHAVVLARRREDAVRRLDDLPGRARFGTSVLCGTPQDAIEHYRPLIGAGIRYLIAGVRGDLDTLRLLAEAVLPELRRAANDRS